MTEKIKKSLNVFHSVLRKEGIPVDTLYVFGSAARGTMHQWSDIDVGVIGPAFGTDRIAETVTLRGLSYDVNPAISPIPLRPEDLQDRYSPIGQAIRREGIEIK